jgi:hypothetical protein
MRADARLRPQIFNRAARQAAPFNPPWVISYEQNIPIMVRTGIRTPISQALAEATDLYLASFRSH